MTAIGGYAVDETAAAIAIIDRLVKFRRYWQTESRRSFEDFIEPLYTDAELVVRDYLSFLTDLKGMVRDAADAHDMIEWIERKRVELLPMRIKLRGVLPNRDRDREASDTFYRGLWGIMEGGNLLVSEGRMQTYNDPRLRGHTILDLLYLLSQEPHGQSRDRFLDAIDEQQIFIERAWHDVVVGYHARRERVYGKRKE